MTETPQNTDSMSKQKSNDNPNPWVKLLLDLGPLVVFFVANSQFGIMTATAIFMGLMPVVMFLSWRLHGHIPVMLWVTAVLVAVFGGLTLYLDDERFIKIKPTIINAMFAIILLVGQMRGKILLKTVMGAAFPPMHERGWQIMNRNWVLFFFAMALLNEFVWRSFSTDTWVSFKAFGFTTITFIFAMAQTPVLMKYQIPETDGEEAE